MSGKQKNVDPVEAMKVMRASDLRRDADEPELTVTKDDLTPGKLPDLTLPATVRVRVYTVQEDRTVLVRGVQTLYRKGRKLTASDYGADVIASLQKQGLKMTNEETDA